MERVLSESNGVQIIRDDEKQAYLVRENGECVYRVPIVFNKELACMRALSEYLKLTGVIDRSYDDVTMEIIPYDRLVDIATRAIRGMTEREEFIDVFLTDEEAEFLDVVDKPYEIRTYHVQKTVCIDVTIAVHEDASETDIEHMLEDHCDNLDEHSWDFEDYDFYNYDTEAEEVSAKELMQWEWDKEFVVEG